MNASNGFVAPARGADGESEASRLGSVRAPARDGDHKVRAVRAGLAWFFRGRLAWRSLYEGHRREREGN